jgi:endonuclease YncB( thermonuclease family)
MRSSTWRLSWLLIAACVMQIAGCDHLPWREPSKAKLFSGKVTRVLDGDTFEMIEIGKDDKEQMPLCVRLAHVDAPELGQAFGAEAKARLEAKVLDKEISVLTDKDDRRGHSDALVFADDKWVNEDMLSEGFGWLVEEGIGGDMAKATLPEAFEKAQAAKLGLWADPSPIPPWAWKARERADSAESSR